MTAKTLCEHFQETVARHPDKVALIGFGSSSKITFSGYLEAVRRLASALHRLGVRRGDAVALMLANRPEFHLADTAAIHLGAIPFSVYNTSSPEQIAQVVGNSGARVLICERDYLPRAQAAGAKLDHLLAVEDLSTLAEDPGFDFEASWRAVRPDDVLTLIYTSGTTGPAKGVELTHANLLAEAAAVTSFFDLRADDRITSYLPSAHIADRLSCHYLQMIYGVEITCIADLTRLVEALPSVRPTFWVAVPRVWEKMKLRIEQAVASAAPHRRALFTWALGQGLRRVRTGRTTVAGRVVDRLVLARIRYAMGLNEMRWAMSGAAAIPVPTLEFFLALGLPVCEIWGMSEVCGAGTANPPGRIRPGSVGVALPGAQLRLADDGELLIRGPMVMRGYRNDPERTAEVLDPDGWLRTGDVCTLDDEGYYTLVDRKKELIINAAGKNMSPTNIENAIKAACPLIAAIIVVGDARPYNVALVSLDPEACVGVTDIPAAVAAGIEAGNARLSRVEQVKRHSIVDGVWMPGGDELTPTLKLRRQAILRKYSSEIEALYG